MSAVRDEKAGPVALLEATAEAQTLIEDVSRLAEELKVREQLLRELHAPGMAGLQARAEEQENVRRERWGDAAPAGGPEREAERRTRALSREEIAQSAELQRRYVEEYASMLRVVPDREVAKEAARVNVSAFLLGQPRFVPTEGHYSVEKLRSALARAGEDLGAIRRALSRLVERAAPAISRLP